MERPMSRRTVFLPYRPKTILTTHKRVDHWFWTRYSASPYISCQAAGDFCYCRERTHVTVAFSIISTPESPNHTRVQEIERLSPPAEKRLAAMEQLAAAGIPTGTCFMQILPGLCDDDANLDSVVRWTADHGGQFVLAGGVDLAHHQ